MKKKVVLWPYLPGQKSVIVEDTVANGRQIVFFNSSTREFELIDTDIRQVSGSLDDFEESFNNDELHILHTGGSSLKDLLGMLKKRNIMFIEKKETYV